MATGTKQLWVRGNIRHTGTPRVLGFRPRKRLITNECQPIPPYSRRGDIPPASGFRPPPPALSSFCILPSSLASSRAQSCPVVQECLPFRFPASDLRLLASDLRLLPFALDPQRASTPSFKDSMRLERATLLNRLAKKCAAPLSYLLCSRLLHKPARAFDAYLNFLLGRGAGTGWDLQHEIQTALSCVHSERPVVFDVGANVGEWSKGFLAAAPQARLYLVEPSPGCQREIQALGLPYAALIPCAVGDSAGKASLHFSSAVDGTASLHPRGDSYFQDRTYQTVEVEVTTIDQLLAQHQIEFVDFMKMDIEGHELQALQGAATALKQQRIGALSFEFGSGNINSRTYFRDFWELLSTHNFRLSRITPSGRLVPVDDYYEDCEYFRGVTNYVAQLKDHPKKRA